MDDVDLTPDNPTLLSALEQITEFQPRKHTTTRVVIDALQKLQRVRYTRSIAGRYRVRVQIRFVADSASTTTYYVRAAGVAGSPWRECSVAESAIVEKKLLGGSR